MRISVIISYIITKEEKSDSTILGYLAKWLSLMTMVNMKLKNRLKELRARDGLNQTELAKLAGISRQTISLLERDEYTPSIIIALKISQIFHEPVESVFRLEEEES